MSSGEVMRRILRCGMLGKPVADTSCSVRTQPKPPTEGHWYKSALLQEEQE